MSIHSRRTRKFLARSATLVAAPFAALIALAPTPAAGQLTTNESRILQQGAAGIPGAADGDEQFGKALAAGDFDADGYDDLAIGAPNENLAPVSNAGIVTVIYGTTPAEIGDDAEIWAIDDMTDLDPLSDDRFGAALAVGNFDGDAFADLAIGIPGRRVQRPDLSLHDGAGAVVVLYGTIGGLATWDAAYFDQEFGTIDGVAEENDLLGSSLAVGDFDGDGYDDLAIGAPGEDVGDLVDAGAVNVLYGSSDGLTVVGDDLWTQDDIAVGGDEPGDEFGAALAAGDFDGDGDDDLAIGAPGENWLAIEDAGSVYQLRGGAFGLTNGSGAPFVVQDTITPGASEESDGFGARLAAGDLDGDGIDDLVVSSPGEGIDIEAGSFPGLGQVQILFGVAGVGASPAVVESLSRFDFEGELDVEDRLGSAVAVGDFDGTAGADLAIAAPLVDVGEDIDAGEVYVGYGPGFDPPGLGEALGQAGELPGVAETGDRFGEALVVGDFDGNGFDDLAVGVPYEAVGEIPSAGAVNLLFSDGIFRHGFEGLMATWEVELPPGS